MKPTTDATRATAEAMPAEKSDLLDIADTIHQARLLVGCICMAAASLSGNERDAISIVGDAARDKLIEARNALEAICEASQGEGAEPRAIVNGGSALSEMLAVHADTVASINRHKGEPDHPEVVALCKQLNATILAICGYHPLTKDDERLRAEFLRERFRNDELNSEEQDALIASLFPEGDAA